MLCNMEHTMVMMVDLAKCVSYCLLMLLCLPFDAGIPKSKQKQQD